MNKFINFLNNQNKYLFLIFFFIYQILLIIFYTSQVNYNINLLLHLNEQYYKLNSQTQFPSMVILKQEGYDGQFYYFISRFIYDPNIEKIYLDSVEFRFLRMGAALIYGIIPSFTGWNFYVMNALFINFLIFSISYILLYDLLKQENKYLAFIYLFNPFTILSNMLLLADTIFTGFFIIFLYLLKKAGISIESIEKPVKINYYYIAAMSTGILLILIKETVIFYFLTFLFLSRIKKNKVVYISFLFLLISFVIWYFSIKHYISSYPSFISLSEVSHTSRIRIPFESIKNIILHHISNFKLHNSIPIFLLILLYFSLLFNLKNLFSSISSQKTRQEVIYQFILYIPILFIITIIPVVDIEYWFAFDNISRIFLFAFLWIILLKNLKQNDYNDYYFLTLSIVFDFLFLIRYFYKKIREFYIL